MFLGYYGLREQPFGITPNPRYLYHGSSHREALASLVYGIECDLGFAALVAEPGMGKTTLLYYLLEKYDDHARTALIFNTQCGPTDLTRYLLAEMDGGVPGHDPVVLHERLKQLLAREARAGRRVIVIIDEAQNLDDQALEAIRLLSDFETPECKLMHIILAGQPGLQQMLTRPELRQLLQRINIWSRLEPFSVEDVDNYIKHRLAVAGHAGSEIFSQHAVPLIASLTGGVPREINRLCFGALSLGYALRQRVIRAELIEEVAEDITVESARSTGRVVPGCKLEEKPCDQVRRPANDKAEDSEGWLIDCWFDKPSRTAAPAETTIAAAPLQSSAIDESETVTSALKVAVEPLTTKFAEPFVFRGQQVISEQPEVDAGGGTDTSHNPKAGIRLDSNLEDNVHAGSRRRVRLRALRRAAMISAATILVVTAVFWSLTHFVLAGDAAANGQASGLADQTVPAAVGDAAEVVLPNSAEEEFAIVVQGRGLWYGVASAEGGIEKTTESRHSVLTKAGLLRLIDPVYPEMAKRAGIEGVVDLAATVAKDGFVRKVQAESLHPILAQAAQDAVRHWRYQPAYKQGEPVEASKRVKIFFKLQPANDK